MAKLSMFSLTSIEKRYHKRIGLLYGLASHFVFVVGHYFVQKVSHNLTALQILHYIGVQLTCYNCFFLSQNNLSPYSQSAKINKLLLYRGLIGFWAGCFILTGLTLVPLSEAVVVQMTGPAITGLLAIFLLNEKYDVTLFLTTIFSFIGVTLIAKPTFLFGETQQIAGYEYKTLGIFLTLAGAFVNALAQILIKKLGAVSNAYTTALYLGIFQIMTCPILQIFLGINSVSFIDLFWSIVIGILRFLAHFLQNKSFAFEEAGKVSLMSYLQLPFAYIIDLFIVQNTFDLYSLLGSISVFSCVFVMLRKK